MHSATHKNSVRQGVLLGSSIPVSDHSLAGGLPSLSLIHWRQQKEKVKEADLYSAFIEVPYTQGAQVRITQFYLQITPYLPLPRKHSPDGASQKLTN